MNQISQNWLQMNATPSTSTPAACVKCKRCIRNRSEAFTCGLCQTQTHVTCAGGIYTPAELYKLRCNKFPFIFACERCRQILQESRSVIPQLKGYMDADTFKAAAWNNEIKSLIATLQKAHDKLHTSQQQREANRNEFRAILSALREKTKNDKYDHIQPNALRRELSTIIETMDRTKNYLSYLKGEYKHRNMEESQKKEEIALRRESGTRDELDSLIKSQIQIQLDREVLSLHDKLSVLQRELQQSRTLQNAAQSSSDLHPSTKYGQKMELSTAYAMSPPPDGMTMDQNEIYRTQFSDHHFSLWAWKSYVNWFFRRVQRILQFWK